MTFINFCGKTVPAAEKTLTAENRAFNYGDSLLETIRAENGIPLFFDAHHARLLKGALLLQMDTLALPGKDQLRELIMELLKLNHISEAVVRLQVFREGRHLFDAGQTGFMISCKQLPPPAPAGGISVGIYRDARKPADKFSSLKHGNFLPYFMGALYACNNNLDDAIILNTNGRICDSCIANVFLISSGKIITPALSEGCVEGIFRQRLIDMMRIKGMDIRETRVTEPLLMEAEEVFLTNSIRGIIPVKTLEGKIHASKETGKLIHIMKEQAV